MAEENNKIEYPDRHPKGKEISAIKSEIDQAFVAYKKLMESARFQYKIQDTALKIMGSNLKEAQEILEKVAPKFKELEDIITEPLI